MTKKKTTKSEIQSPADAAKSWREAVESIVIAIVLAFLFRAFEAEAFVIPTGSMAPTLQGRHKDVKCPECMFRYRVGASLENEVREGPVIATTCPMCFYTLPVDATDPGHFSHTGDRILVNKFAYERPFGDPQRWDVIVFKYPGNAKQNYIKRLVGLPGETLKIRHGDIFTKNADGEPYSIARKPPDKLQHMLQLVHDTRYRSPTLHEVGWPLSWQAYGDESSWNSEDGGESYLCDADDDPDWMRFRHFYLDFDTWRQVLSNQKKKKLDLEGIRPMPVIITDFYAYNAQTRSAPMGAYHPAPMGTHWVGDLAVEAEVEVLSDTGQIHFDLVEAGRHHTCRIDIETGTATLAIDGGGLAFDGQVDQPSAKTRLKGEGRYKIRFANADDQLVLWVNGSVCEFDSETTFVAPRDDIPATSADDPGDLAPIGIGAANAQLKVNRLRVLRDIYYIATDSIIGVTIDYPDSQHVIAAQLTDPSYWNPRDSIFGRRREVEFELKEDWFFPLGDNSPYSRDGRLWGMNQHYVERDLLIGKAIVIYWPHAWRIPNPLSREGSIPLIPNFQRIGLIH